MTAPVQLEIQGDTTNFTLAVEGAFFPRIEAEYKVASNPREVIALREVWEVRGCRIVTADNTIASTWSQFEALVARVGVRSNAFPAYARFVLGGTTTALRTLGPSTYEDFQIDAIDGEQDPDVDAASWRTTSTFTLRFSAVRRFVDTNGIVGWEQEVDSSYPEGRHRLEWRTRVTTAEGTSALSKALAYAAIDASALGTTYLYETGGTAGAVDVVELDADEENGRTPTVVEAVSRVRSYGTTIGAVSPGASPSAITYSIVTRSTPEETATTTTASADGPGALAFVQSKRPAVYNEEELHNDEAEMKASAMWTQRDKRVKDEKLSLLFSRKVTVSGGLRVVDYEPVADGGDPVEFAGAYAPVVAVVEVELERTGDLVLGERMLLPGHPGDPWRFDALASQEGAPYVSVQGATAAASTWKREARLVFRAARPPAKAIQAAMDDADPVASYIYAAA